jgi:dipeptidyl aminopeptidase/acylaminoacyl peptidase
MRCALFFDSAPQYLRNASMTALNTPLTWQRPAPEIDAILNASPLPSLSISPNHRWLLELRYVSLQPIEELMEPELGLAGFRFNPQTHGPARSNPWRSLHVRPLRGGDWQAIPLPANAGINEGSWSPEGDRFAFTLIQATGLELWLLDLSTVTVTQVTGPILNAVYGVDFTWLDGSRFLCSVVPEQGDPPKAALVPPGPLVQENFGQKSPGRTYTHLLKSSHDEALFDYYASSALEIIGVGGDRQTIIARDLIKSFSISPNGQFILLNLTRPPYSYQFPCGRFPRCIQVIDLAGNLCYTVAETPLVDYLSTKFNAVRRGRREIGWRSDQPATLFWAEALDEGDPAKSCEERDALYELAAPFTEDPHHLWTGTYRYGGVTWGREDVAFVWESWHDTKQMRLWCINPSQFDQTHIVFEHSYEDKYNHPGSPLIKRNHYNRSVLRFTPDGKQIYLSGRGAEPKGVYPFLDRFDWRTGQTERIWQCQEPYLETLTVLLDDEAKEFITSRQSQDTPSNLYLYQDGGSHALTDYRDPVPLFAGVQEEVIDYQREDGVKLSAKLYLPAGYDPQKDGPLPTMFWVYPEEFKDANFAGQNNRSRHAFIRPGGCSPLFLLTQGYAVLSSPSLPIVGEGEDEPNDTYVEQLISGAEAAIDYLVVRGIADRSCIGVGGHSYGAFTTVNLLAHTDLFCMGIARSGAYNRTLTPFGFQGEQRDFWEAMQTYIHVSPFTHAHKMDKPLLLIHGQDDSNPGTYPIQTERLFEALKGLGATVRWVVLPLEDHGYRSKEGVGHTLWEMVRWCNLHFKMSSGA